MSDQYQGVERTRAARMATVSSALAIAQEMIDHANERRADTLLKDYEQMQIVSAQRLVIGTGALLPEYKPQADAMAQITGANDTYYKVADASKLAGVRPSEISEMIENGHLATKSGPRGSRLVLWEEVMVALATYKGGQRPLVDNVVRLATETPRQQVANDK